MCIVVYMHLTHVCTGAMGVPFAFVVAPLLLGVFSGEVSTTIKGAPHVQRGPFIASWSIHEAWVQTYTRGKGLDTRRGTRFLHSTTECSTCPLGGVNGGPSRATVGDGGRLSERLSTCADGSGQWL